MKNSPIITVLVMAACVLGFVVLGLAAGYEIHYRQLRRLEPDLVKSQNARKLIDMLAVDALEYSKTHPAIDSILATVGVKPVKTSAAPAGKPK